VTTTHSRTGNFQTRFYNLVTQTEIASVKGHFGPIHTLQFSPDGKSFASGSEDGYVRIHHFDPSYYSLGVDEPVFAAPASAAGKAPKKDA
jgi:translation initiation factor 3 subunit I